jgi:hypothetical protein
VDLEHQTRRLVFLIDAVNEAEDPKGLLEEASELAAQAAVANIRDGRPWVRLLFSVRTHAVTTLMERWGERSNAPFLANQHNFAHFEDGQGRRVPYLTLRSFTVEEAAEAYERARKALAHSCPASWTDLAPPTRNLLRHPMLVRLFHGAFAGNAHPPAAATADALWSEWLKRAFEPSKELENSTLDLADACIATGANQVPDEVTVRWRAKWQEDLGDDPVRIAASLDPLERLAEAGLLRRQEGGGWDWVSDSLAEQVYFRALQRRDPELTEGSLQEWLKLPRTPRLDGALVEVGATCWHTGRPLALRAYVSAASGRARKLLGQVLLDVVPRGKEAEIRAEVEQFYYDLQVLTEWCVKTGRSRDIGLLKDALLWDVGAGLADRWCTIPFSSRSDRHRPRRPMPLPARPRRSSTRFRRRRRRWKRTRPGPCANAAWAARAFPAPGSQRRLCPPQPRGLRQDSRCPAL